MVRPDHDDELTAKIIGMYRMLSTTLQVSDAVVEGDAGNTEAVDLSERIRALCAELEQMLDDNSEDPGFRSPGVPSRIRTMEREINEMVVQAKSFRLRRTYSKDGGWSY